MAMLKLGKFVKLNLGLFSLAAVLLIAACSSNAPLAPTSADEQAKEYQPIAGFGAVYVYRKSQFTSRGYLAPITIDDQLYGHISEYEYLRIDVQPGGHRLVIEGGRNSKPAQLEVEPDTVTFVEFRLDDGYAVFDVVDEADAKKAIKKRDLARKYVVGVIPAISGN